MLNRTNRTLLATTNRLNLGTRSLDQVSSGNNGKSTLRPAHVALVVAVRVGFEEHPRAMVGGPPMIGGSYPIAPAMFPMSGSTLGFPQRSPRSEIRDQQQGQPLASKPLRVKPAGDPSVAGRTRRCDASPILSPCRKSRTNLGWRPKAEGLAGRSTRVVLVSVAAP